MQFELSPRFSSDAAICVSRATKLQYIILKWETKNCKTGPILSQKLLIFSRFIHHCDVALQAPFPFAYYFIPRNNCEICQKKWLFSKIICLTEETLFLRKKLMKSLRIYFKMTVKLHFV